MKHIRQQKILELISENIMLTQEDVKAGLEKAGFEVTQSTVSRDIKELKLVKGRDKSGNYRYLSGVGDATPHTENQYAKMFNDGVKNMDFALNNVVIKCFGGMASSVCVALDALFHDMMLGSLAGDDTIIVVTRSEEQSKDLIENLKKLS